MNQKIRKNNEKLKQVLIVSYSYTGNTHKIAQEIQKLTGGDLCEIYPWQPYPMAFPELLAQVKREIAAGYRPRLLAQPYSPKKLFGHFCRFAELVRNNRARRLHHGYTAMIYQANAYFLFIPIAVEIQGILGEILSNYVQSRRCGKL